MDIILERLENGLLKGFQGQISPDEIEKLLSQDVEILVPAARVTMNDLWPAVWALAAVLERELRGRILIRCDFDPLLAAPAALGPRCQFTRQSASVALSISVGCETTGPEIQQIFGDARAGVISFGTLLGNDLPPPLAIECFALAGYLGFAAIAVLVGIPEHRADLALSCLHISYDHRILAARIRDLEGFTSTGVGQVGQAFLALLFFLYSGNFSGRRIAIIDNDSFEPPNGRTQILLVEGGDWSYQKKAPYIANLVRGWGATALECPDNITWTWKRKPKHPVLALVGLHDFETRRMVCAAGFQHLVEAGVGTNLMRPRVSWHLLPGDTDLGRRVFPNVMQANDAIVEGSWVDALKNAPDGCGWVRFQGISATAPCLGIAAVGFALAELGGELSSRRGAGWLWSPCLPLLREALAWDRTQPALQARA